MSNLYVKIKGRVHGPVTEEALQRLVRRGVVTPNTEVSEDGQHWRRAAEVEYLFPSSLADRAGVADTPGAIGTVSRGRPHGRRLPWFSEELLLPTEEVLHVGEVSPFCLVGPSVILFVVTAVTLFIPAPGTLELILRVGLVLVFWTATVVFLITHYMFSGCIVTDKRIVGTAGVVRRRIAIVHLSEVSAILVRQGLFGRLLGYGTLVVACAGCENAWRLSKIVFPYYARIIELAKAISASSLRVTTSNSG